MAFANVPEEQCMASDQPALAPAFKLHSYEHGWHLPLVCMNGSSILQVTNMEMDNGLMALGRLFAVQSGGFRWRMGAT